MVLFDKSLEKFIYNAQKGKITLYSKQEIISSSQIKNQNIKGKIEKLSDVNMEW